MSTTEAKTGTKRKAAWQPPVYKKRNVASTAKGFAGILVTCDRTKERQVVKDILNILNDTADKHYPKDLDENDDDDDDADDDSKTSAEKLAEEIKGLKKDKGRFIALDSGVKGIIMIQIADKKIPVVALVNHIFEEIEATKQFSSRFIQRVIPLENLCFPDITEITEAVTPYIERHFKDTKDLTFSVEVKKRNSGNIASMDIINACVAVVGPAHKVNLTTPDVVILIEIFKNVCGVSVVTNFHQFRKFNVRSILDPPPVTGTKKESLKKPSTEEKTKEVAEEDDKEEDA
ncbi:hypothetical protein SDRG_04587 [Saprolegnia diclina VS20]|uniref:THUMP domain-containing protein n=1 Tax=Saprolegnia diclina (strain VS20) TaxID=1156394 RepID=T0RZZ5_SAPDV|nr:hypothetical protein SDRG_04587 [Saprolegnia diclina VS20]EQC38158.1 hypothetical protein SDRG_04587 [Saprolegnia diclina VS20]|eukprot:XP_008608485.1 hypothetical protein SDRG_04587 [Saprolegnia diclina VS20]